MDKYFVTVHLVVQESGEKEALENAGGEDYMKALKGERAGLPFYAFLNAQGKMIINAMQMKRGETKGNIGHPMAPEEVTNFLMMVKKAAPKMTAKETKVLEDWLRSQEN